MAFDLPLPSITDISIPNQLSILNALQKKRLENQYYGPSQQAQIQLAQSQAAAAPLYPIARIASNPLLWPTDPNQQQAFRNSLNNIIARSVNNLSNVQPGGGQNLNQNPYGNGVFQMLLDKFNGNNNNSNMSGGNVPQTPTGNAILQSPTVDNSQNQQNSNFSQPQQNQSNDNNAGSSLIPQGSNIAQGAQSALTGKYGEQIHSPGILYIDPKTGDFRVSPTAGNVGQYQASLGAIQRTLPIIDRLSNESQEFLQEGSKAKLFLNNLANEGIGYGVLDPKIAKRFGADPDMISRYNKWQSDIQMAKEGLKNSFLYPNAQETINQLSTVVAPSEGELAQGYASRINKLSDQLKNETIPTLNGILRNSFNVSANQKNNNQNTNQNPKSSKMYKIFSPSGILKGLMSQENSDRLLQDHPGWYRTTA